jgi:hypothetical protein
MRNPSLLQLTLGIALIGATGGALLLPDNEFFWGTLVYIPSLVVLLAGLHRSRSVALPLPARSGDIACPRQSP